MITVNHTFIHFVHCKNKLRNIRTWGNAHAIQSAREQLRQAAAECRAYSNSHKPIQSQIKAMEAVS